MDTGEDRVTYKKFHFAARSHIHLYVQNTHATKFKPILLKLQLHFQLNSLQFQTSRLKTYHSQLGRNGWFQFLQLRPSTHRR